MHLSFIGKTLNIDKKIINCHTIAELNSLQRMHTLTEQEQRLVFERQMEIF